METLKVATSSNAKSISGAIAGMVRDGKEVELIAIGAPAVAHTVKAIAFARQYLREDGIEISFKVSMEDVRIRELERTAIRFLVVSRALLDASINSNVIGG